VRTVDAQKLCNINIEEEELSFKSHETLTYAASYSWGFLFTDVGEVVLKINKTKLFPIEYHVTADAKTYKFYDRFFKVRDFYESKFIIPDMRSIYFYRNILEGDYTMKNTYNFDWENNKINAVIQRQKAPAKNIEINLNTCTLDVLSYFYYLRNLDFSDACPNSVYVISIALDHEVYSIKCRFLGKEQKKIKALKTKINCLKFAVEVIAGNVFKGNESITMWVSDDKNHIPLELESPITVGKLKGRILKHENLKYPLNIVE
jgi:hypothetical protein